MLFMNGNARCRGPRYPWEVNSRHVDLLAYERKLLSRGEIVVGIDEVGRGALAGPLMVGAVVVVDDYVAPEELDDSKLLTSERREALVEPLKEWAADWSLGTASAQEIDAWGLRLALAVAATRALTGLKLAPTHALIDGSFNLLRSPLDIGFGVEPPPELCYSRLACTTIVKGDQKCASIAAAAVLAKVSRDLLMVELHERFPEFGWSANKGYGAPEHLVALRNRGPSTEHRRSWKLPPQDAIETL
jgi:ribonuclease HII